MGCDLTKPYANRIFLLMLLLSLVVVTAACDQLGQKTATRSEVTVLCNLSGVNS